MKFDHTVKIGGIYYPADTEIKIKTEEKPEGTTKNKRGKEREDE